MGRLAFSNCGEVLRVDRHEVIRLDRFAAHTQRMSGRRAAPRQ